MPPENTMQWLWSSFTGNLCYFQACVNWLLERISVDTACESLQAAVTYAQDQLRDETLKFIAANAQVESLLLAPLSLHLQCVRNPLAVSVILHLC